MEDFPIADSLAGTGKAQRLDGIVAISIAASAQPGNYCEYLDFPRLERSTATAARSGDRTRRRRLRARYGYGHRRRRRSVGAIEDAKRHVDRTPLTARRGHRDRAGHCGYATTGGRDRYAWRTGRHNQGRNQRRIAAGHRKMQVSRATDGERII